jgi:peptidoglycan/LPS O-acetylase OafA/YrhL
VGVSSFFALSGFVLTWSLRAADTKRAFYRRRFARVYPLHFLTLLFAVPFFLFAGKGLDPGQLVSAGGLL